MLSSFGLYEQFISHFFKKLSAEGKSLLKILARIS